MSTVLRREPPFKTIFGYATLFGEDGRPMHKSWGNAIEFNEAAERMGVDVMRWMYAKAAARGQHPVRLPHRRRGAPRAARAVERLRVLHDLRPTGRLAAVPRRGRAARGRRDDARPLDPVAHRGRGRRRCETELADFDARGAARAPSASTSTSCRPGTCAAAAGASRAIRDAADRDAAFATLHAALVGTARMLAPILPFLAEYMYQRLVVGARRTLPATRCTSRAGRTPISPR